MYETLSGKKACCGQSRDQEPSDSHFICDLSQRVPVVDTSLSFIVQCDGTIFYLAD